MLKNWIPVVVASAITAAVTYQISAQQHAAELSHYIKKDELKKQLDQYISDSSMLVYASVLQGIETLKQMEQEKYQQAIREKAEILENDTSSPSYGSEDGDVKVVMFSDYQCSFCQKNEPILKQLVENDPGVQLIIKEFPILGDGSIISAKAALSVYHLDKTKYEAFHSLLFNNIPGSEQDIVDLANQVDLDPEQLLLEMARPKYDEVLLANQQLGAELGISGTPAFVIDGTLYPGALQQDQLMDLIRLTRDRRGKDKVL